MIALAVLLTGHESAGPFVGVSAIVVIVSLAVFAANVLMNVRAAP